MWDGGDISVLISHAQIHTHSRKNASEKGREKKWRESRRRTNAGKGIRREIEGFLLCRRTRTRAHHTQTRTHTHTHTTPHTHTHTHALVSLLAVKGIVQTQDESIPFSRRCWSVPAKFLRFSFPLLKCHEKSTRYFPIAVHGRDRTLRARRNKSFREAIEGHNLSYLSPARSNKRSGNRFPIFFARSWTFLARFSRSKNER